MSVIPTIAPFLLPRILPRLRRERPALKLFLREETSADAVESLQHGRVDCVLLALPFATGEVEAEHIADDALQVAFPKDMPRNPPETRVPRHVGRRAIAAAGRRALPEGTRAGRLQPSRIERLRHHDRTVPRCTRWCRWSITGSA